MSNLDNIKSRKDCIDALKHFSFSYAYSEWLFDAYTLPDEKLLKFLKFVDSDMAKAVKESAKVGNYDSAEVIRWLDHTPADWSAEMMIFISALTQFGGRVEHQFSKIADSPSGQYVWPCRFEATLIPEGSRTFDTSFLVAVRNYLHRNMAPLVTRLNGEIWVTDNKLYMPYIP